MITSVLNVSDKGVEDRNKEWKKHNVDGVDGDDGDDVGGDVGG